MNNPCIDIVLASCNGEQFIREQIHSIQRCNRYAELVNSLIVVDDKSDDATCNVVAQLAEEDPKIELHTNISNKRHGSKNNFNRGLALTTAPYIALSDQDDIWLPEKLIKLHNALVELEAGEYSQPVLVFSDKVVVDQALNVIQPSFQAMLKVPESWYADPDRMLQQNVVSGCVSHFNRALLQSATPIPKEAVMHDWWLALAALHIGRIRYIQEPLIQYRQHAGNQVGAPAALMTSPVATWLKRWKKFRQSFLAIQRQTAALYQTLGLAVQPASTAESLIEFKRLTKAQRVMRIIKGKIARNKFSGQMALFIAALLEP